MNKKRSMAIRTITGVAILTAIVIVLQLLGQFIRFGPFSVSLVLVPIVIGAALYGPWAGCWLGFVFGVVVLLQPDTGFFLNFNPFATIIVCLIKGAAAGLCAGLVYKAFEKINAYLAVILAAIVCPVVNSGLFFIGSVLFFIPLIEEAFSLEAGQGIKFVIVGMIGLNFVFELLFNIVLSPVILRLVRLVKKEQPKAVKAAAPAKPVEEIKEKASEAAEKAEEKAESLKEKAEEKVEDVKEKAADLKEKAADKAEEAKEKAAEVVEDIKEKAEDLKEKAADKAEGAKEKAAEVVEDVKETVSDAADKVEDTAADIVENAVEDAKLVAADVKEVADKVEDKAADAVETVVDKFEDLTKKD
ncbi:MAG: ECF transporter S component [Oscillospiraceae bacterium]|nr:ECF transporter S component [Oscillospiraceae bacterium]